MSLPRPENLSSKDFDLTPDQAAQIRPLVYECQLLSIKPTDSSLKTYRLTFFPGQAEIVPSTTFDLAFREASNLVSNFMPGIWHTIARIDDDYQVTLDAAYLSSSGHDLEDIFEYFNSILGIPTLEPNTEALTFSIEVNPMPVAYQRAGQPQIKITEEHLAPLLNNLPPIPAGTSEHRRRMETFFQDLIRELLLGTSIHPDGLSFLLKRLTELLIDAIAPALTPVGLILTDAIAAKLMQQALDRKHGAGIGKGVEAGVNILREVLRALKKLKTPEMRAFFRNRRISHQEAELYQLRYQQVLLPEILTKDPEIISEDGTDFVLPDHPGWAERYAELEGFEIPVVRDKAILTVDIQKLYNQGLSLRDLLRVLKREFDSQHSGMLRFLVSPRIVLDEQAKTEGKTLRTTWIIAKIVILPDPDVAFRQITTNKKLIDKFANYILDKNQRKLREYTFKVLLIDVISPILKRMLISGIPDIAAVEVASRTISTYYLKEIANADKISWSSTRLDRFRRKYESAKAKEPVKATKEPEPAKSSVKLDNWTLHLNRRTMLLDMILSEDIRYFLNYVGFEVIDKVAETGLQPETLVIVDPLGLIAVANLGKRELVDIEIKTLKASLKPVERKKKIDEIRKKHIVDGPMDYAHRLYMKDVDAEKIRKRAIALSELKAMQEYARQRELGGIEAGMPPFPWSKFIVKQELTPLMAANRVNYLVFDGSNVKALLEKPEIDSRTIYSTNSHQMLEFFGIAVTRQGIMLRLASVMGDDNNYIDPSYILMMAEILTNRGRYYGTSYEGLKQQQTNIMSLITVEQPMRALLKMAKHSAQEESSGVSAEMMLGLESRLGSGAVSLVVVEELISEMAEKGLQFSMADIESYLSTRESAGKPTPSLNVTRPLQREPDLIRSSATFESSGITDFPSTNNLIFSPAMYGIGQKLIENSEVVEIEPIESEVVACPIEPVRAPVVLNSLPVLVPGSLPKSRFLTKLLTTIVE